MDSQVVADGRLLELIDEDWRKDQLPKDDIAVPFSELPDPEADNGNTGESLREQENKWNELGLANISETNATGQN